MSSSQAVRIETERWVSQHGYCLACDSDRLLQTQANTPARDFECAKCSHPYELKASAKPLGAKIVDGAYGTMMKRLEEGSAASFLLMRYSPEWSVVDLVAVHRSLITAEFIERRRPLAVTARRAGWTGCNILIGQVPPEGRIPLVVSNVAESVNVARERFQKAERLSALSLDARGWTVALLTRLHRLPFEAFTLQDAYGFEGELQSLFPKNQHVREKIRQQLQVLRDAGMVKFEGQGHYRLKTKGARA